MDSLYNGLFAGTGIASIARMANPAVPLSCETIAAGGAQPGSSWEGHRYRDLQLISGSMDLGYWQEVEEGAKSGTPKGAYHTDIKELLSPAELAAATCKALESYGCDKSEARSSANAALLDHPHCPEACAILGLYSDSLEEALEHYRKGEAMGKDTIRKFDTLAKEMKGNAWEWIPARGYMRCLHGVANTLRKLHARSDPRDNKAAEESLALYQQLQRLQSTRKGFSSYVNFAYHLPEAYLRCGDDPGFNALWANAKLGADMCLYMSSQLGWVMSRVLQDYRKDPLKARWQWADFSYRESRGLQHGSEDTIAYRMCMAGGGIIYALGNFPLLTGLLTGRKAPPQGTLPLVFGSSDSWEQAVAYFYSSGDLWDHGARRWLADHANSCELLQSQLGEANTSGDAGTLECVRLIEDGIPVGDIQEPGQRIPGPLHQSAYYDKPPELVSALLEAGVNPLQTGGPNTGPNGGSTTAGMAANQGNHRPLRLILEFIREKHPQRLQATMDEVLKGLMTSSVYFCVMGLQPACPRCSHAPHSPHVSFEKCIQVLIDMGLTELKPGLRRSLVGAVGGHHPLLRLLDMKLKKKSTGKKSQPAALPSSEEVGSGSGSSGSRAKHCAVCRAEEGPEVKLKSCNGCMTVRYCGVVCQKKDWKQHKPECRRLQKLKE